MSKNKGLMLAAGGIGIVGLAWYLSQSGGPTEGGNQGGGGGGGLGGFFMPGSGTPGVSAGNQEPNVIYNVSFPPSIIPDMPTYPDPVLPSPDPSPDSTKKSQNFIPANIPGNDTGTKYGITTLGPAFWHDPGAAAYYSSLINSGALDTPQTPGTASTKKSQNYIPANIPGSDTGTDYGITILGPATTASHTITSPFTKEEYERGYVGH